MKHDIKYSKRDSNTHTHTQTESATGSRVAKKLVCTVRILNNAKV